jgi:fucose 4-O-acetylase-like acetyltransferase
MTSNIPLGNRIAWIDTARAYGIFLVYYGHLVESMGKMGNEAALAHTKLVYAFHMPLFILLSGYLAKSQLPGPWTFLKKQAATRLLPVVFFSVMMMPLIPLLESVMGWEGWDPAMKAEWVDDWPKLCKRLVPPHDGDQESDRTRLWERFAEPARQVARQGAGGADLSPAAKKTIVTAINTLLADRDLFSPESLAGRKLPYEIQQALDQGTTNLADGDAVRSHNLQLTWWTLYPEEEWWWEGGPYWKVWLKNVLTTLRGYPEFNWLTWFLICLFTVEGIHFLAVRFLTSSIRVAAAIPLFFAVGWFATLDLELKQDIWFIREGLLLYSFYLLGYLLRRIDIIERMESRWAPALLFIVSGAIVLGTFQLNPGSKMYTPVVLINLSQHGHPGYFALTAVAGCLATIALAYLSPPMRLLSTVGRNSLALMALNVFYFNFINYAIADALKLPPSHLQLALWCVAISMGAMALLTPLIWLLNRYVPQLVGRPSARGPWLPPLV